MGEGAGASSSGWRMPPGASCRWRRTAPSSPLLSLMWLDRKVMFRIQEEWVNRHHRVPERTLGCDFKNFDNLIG